MLQRCITFLREIGLEVREEVVSKGFLPNIRIADGVLYIDPSRCAVSDLLHEAGHIAIVPGRYRSWMQDDLMAGVETMRQDLEARGVAPCSKMMSACIEISDAEATAWAFAAGRHLSIPDERIIEDGQYDRTGEEIRSALALNAYPGIHGLAHAGFCVTQERLTKYSGLPCYPRLAMWVQKDDLDEGPIA